MSDVRLRALWRAYEASWQLPADGKRRCEFGDQAVAQKYLAEYDRVNGKLLPVHSETYVEWCWVQIYHLTFGCAQFNLFDGWARIRVSRGWVYYDLANREPRGSWETLVDLLFSRGDPDLVIRSALVATTPRRLSLEWIQGAEVDLHELWGLDAEVYLVQELARLRLEETDDS